MLIHKSDIEKRLEENPEPIEVTKMREHILSSFANLEFIEEGHIYNLHNADGTVIEKIPSASTIIARYEPESDWDEIASRYALKYDSTKEQVQRMWHENNIKATNNGSSVHLYGENLQRFITNLKEEEICDVIKPQYEDGYLIPYGPKQDAIQKYWQDLLNIPEIYPLLPECKMYMPLGNKFGIKEIFCGTADTTLAYTKDVAIGAGAGALAGVIISPMSGGSVGRGTALGTAVGAGGGLVKSFVDKGVDACLDANSLIQIVLDQPMTYTNANRY